MKICGKISDIFCLFCKQAEKVIYDCKRESSSERCVLALLWKTRKLHELLLAMKISLQDFCIFWPVTQKWYTDVTEGLKRLKARHMGLQHHHWSHLSQHVEGDFKYTTSLVYPELFIIHEQLAFFEILHTGGTYSSRMATAMRTDRFLSLTHLRCSHLSHPEFICYFQ